MDQELQDKIDQYIEMAKSLPEKIIVSKQETHNQRPDGLSQVIRTKKDAEDFMAEINMAFDRAN